MSVQNALKSPNRGEQVQYNGENVKVSSVSAGYITVVNDKGERISVPRKSPLLSFARDNKELKEYIKQKQENIKNFNKIWDKAKDAKWAAIRGLNKFLSELGIHNGSSKGLNDEQLVKYKAFKTQRNVAVTEMNKAGSGVQTTVIEVLSAISSNALRGGF